MSGMSTTTVVTATSVTNQTSQHVTWAEGTVDNEGQGKKKSKKCCIFKKRREFGESSSDSEDECKHIECDAKPSARPISS